MSIQVLQDQTLFHLQTSKTSYVCGVNQAGYLCHLYYGKKINKYSGMADTIFTNFNSDTVPQECASFGTGDFRVPTVMTTAQNGSTSTELLYKSYEILKGKPVISGLPSTYAVNEDEVQTLRIDLADEAIGLRVSLYYSVFEEYNVITRRISYTNEGTKNSVLYLDKAMSFSMDFDHDRFDMIQLSGGWSREKHMYKRALVPGLQSIDSKRGISSAAQNPFIALLSKDASEDFGEVYSYNLVYSGNWSGEVEVDQFFHTRITMGINSFDFRWKLEDGQTFDAPEVVLVFSENGLGEMTRTYHKFYRERLCRGTYQYKERPILVNNWEATYFNFNADKIYEIAMTGKELGLELFVLDDGWFGHRDSDNSSLGDWFVDKKKLPEGLDTLVNKITKEGIRFGLWFEPEMVSPDSDLYRAHPDWCIHVPERSPKASQYQRTQLVLDMSREDVRQAVIKMVSDILSSCPISYVKWDMNRPLCDYGSALLPVDQQREIAHRYMLGVYQVIDTITSAFPEVLFESCCSGGGRFDPGMLYYMPQTWVSDDTDAIERLKIQYGTGMVYPITTMGSHISACPNHQVGRYTSLETRGNVAMCGNFGYELDLTKFSDDEKETVREQVKRYKDIRHIIQFGDLYRMISPYDRDGNETAWMYVTEDKTEAVAYYYRVLARPNMVFPRLRFKGLNPEYSYYIKELDKTLNGDELMNIGVEIISKFGDFHSECWTLQVVK